MSIGQTAWTRMGYRVTVVHVYYANGERRAWVRFTDGRKAQYRTADLLIRA